MKDPWRQGQLLGEWWVLLLFAFAAVFVAMLVERGIYQAATMVLAFVAVFIAGMRFACWYIEVPSDSTMEGDDWP